VFDYVARLNYRLPIREYKFNLGATKSTLVCGLPWGSGTSRKTHIYQHRDSQNYLL